MAKLQCGLEQASITPEPQFPHVCERGVGAAEDAPVCVTPSAHRLLLIHKRSLTAAPPGGEAHHIYFTVRRLRLRYTKYT